MLRVRLSEADLRGANLFRAKLFGAILKNTNLSGANLFETNFSGSDLRGAILRDVNLNRSILNNILLDGAKLDRSSLYSASSEFYNIKLREIDLSGLKLEEIQLSDMNLSNFNFFGTILYGANLKGVQALATNFEGATLTGACIEDWSINCQTNLQNVKCDYIYLNEGNYSKEEEKYIFSDRVPHDPDKIFAPGEFAKRYQKILETVNLYFGEGIDWQVFLNSFQKLQEEEKIKIADGEREIPIVQGIENTGNGSFIIKIGVSPDTDKGEIEKSFWQKYQRMLEAAEEKYRAELNFKEKEIAIYLQQNADLKEIIQSLAIRPIHISQNQGDKNMNYSRETKIDKYFKTEKAGIVYNEGTVSGDVKVAEVINEASQQDLAQAAAEIQQLLDQLSETYPTETFAEKGVIVDKAIEEIEKNPTLKQKIINALKAMTVETFMEAINHPLANVLRAGIEAYREPE